MELSSANYSCGLSLGKLKTEEVVQELISLLQDPFRGVRADAASALLKMQEQHGARPGDLPREYLLDFVARAHELRNWATIVCIGEAASPALELALQDDDPVVRREALQVKRVPRLQSKSSPKTAFVAHALAKSYSARSLWTGLR